MSFMQNHREDSNTTRYYVKNKDKVKSGRTYFVTRSTWEYKFFQWCDINENILYFEAEPLAIPYQHPIEQRDARYFPDALIKCKTKKGNIKTYLVEIKPHKECKQPTKSKGKSKKTVLTEAKTWEINKAKWKAAQRYCKLKGWTFKLITERELFGKD